MLEFVLVAVPLALFVLLAGVFLLILRRAAGVVAETRELETFRRATTELATRIDASLAGVAERIDAVRRRQVGPNEIEANITAALEAVQRYGDEAAALRPPAGLGGLRSGIQEELARAGRALEMVDHGCALLTAQAARQSELEGQTAIKRGYLNILHAREAIARAAGEASHPRVSVGRRWLSERSRH